MGRFNVYINVFELFSMFIWFFGVLNSRHKNGQFGVRSARWAHRRPLFFFNVFFYIIVLKVGNEDVLLFSSYY